MCASCIERNDSIPVPEEHAPNKENPISEIRELESTIRNEIRNHEATAIEKESIDTIGATAIKSSEDFFNAHTVSIVERSKSIYSNSDIPPEQKHYEVAKFVIADILHLKKVLVETASIQLECSSKVRADQVYLNTLAAKLSAEHRSKLHLESPNYEPKKPPTTIPRARVSKFDKAVESFAKAMNIPVEQARRMMEQGLKAKGIICTCKETPGVCKVHQ